ncbi:MAG TPA: radical SAM protein [Longimicrobiales bacterium]
MIELAELTRTREGFTPSDPAAQLPHVVAWNLTRRCNLACAHCYIAAGSWHAAAGELTTDECLRIADEILALNPSPMFILSGGEPLLREDLETLAEHATARGATVVVGTNGTRLTRERIASLKAAGVQGVAVSIDSLDARYHDRFRHGDGALEDTLAAVDRLGAQRLDFIVQTTVTRGNRAELPALAAWAASKGAVAFNVYFLVATGRGAGMAGLSPEENDDVLRELVALERKYAGRMMIRSKCQPQIMRHATRADVDSPLLNYGTRCPCGVHYCRITPEGKVTPCPYSPVVAGDLRQGRFADIWRESPVFRRLRQEAPGGKCGRCEYRELCGGCRARAYAETGDLMGEDPSCAYEPAGDAPVVKPRRAVTYGAAAPATLDWAPEARARLDRVPSFVRGVVTARVEAFARERGYTRVTPEVMAEVRRALPVDFSKKRPFFLDDGAWREGSGEPEGKSGGAVEGAGEGRRVCNAGGNA